MAIKKQLNQQDFSMKIIQDLGMINNKREAIVECTLCNKHFNMAVTSKSKKQKVCKSCTGTFNSLQRQSKKEEKHKTLTHKTCLKCKNLLEIKHFSNRSSSGDGYAKLCKSCAKKEKTLYNQTEIGVLTQLYNSQVANSILRGHTPPTYSRQELIDKYLTDKRFIKYFNYWKEAGFPPYFDKKPSFDRIDDSKPYSLENIRLTTYRRNLLKEHLKYSKGLSNNKEISPVSQIDPITGQVINKFVSIAEASRITNIDNISSVCRGERPLAGGFNWEYS